MFATFAAPEASHKRMHKIEKNKSVHDLHAKSKIKVKCMKIDLTKIL